MIEKKKTLVVPNHFTSIPGRYPRNAMQHQRLVAKATTIKPIPTVTRQRLKAATIAKRGQCEK